MTIRRVIQNINGSIDLVCALRESCAKILRDLKGLTVSHSTRIASFQIVRQNCPQIAPCLGKHVDGSLLPRIDPLVAKRDWQ